jgi:hypothetical protein
MTAALDTTVDLIDVLRAPLAVTCPRCQARPGHECESTGGGNRAYVPTHKARELLVAHWSDAFAADAGRLVKSVLRATFEARAAVDWTRFEAAAAPVAVNTARPSPAAVRLSEKQAQRIEYAAQDGVLYAPTSHFHGDAARRQTIHALEAKGIVVQFDMTPDGYDRMLRLTAYGWQVYRQHPKVIRRLDEAEIAEREAGRDLHDGGEGGSR